MDQNNLILVEHFRKIGHGFEDAKFTIKDMKNI